MAMLTSDLYPAAWLLATLAACDVRQMQGEWKAIFSLQLYH